MPNITSRHYAGPQDLRAMQALVQVTWTRDSHLHIGDLVWQRYPRDPQPGWPTRLWFEDGEIVAWSWAWAGADAAADEDEDEFYFQVRPDRRALCDEVIDWAEAVNPSPLRGASRPESGRGDARHGQAARRRRLSRTAARLRHDGLRRRWPAPHLPAPLT